MKTRIILFFMVAGATLCNWTFAGLAGSALLFDGIDDYVHAPYIPAYQLPVFTVEVWINPPVDLATLTTNSAIFTRSEDSTSDVTALVLAVECPAVSGTSGLTVAYEDNADSDYYYRTLYCPPANTWTHIAATRDPAGQLKVFVNGSLYSQWSSTATPGSNCFQELTIGTYWSNYLGSMSLESFFTGVIDEVRLWNVARTDAEIAENYNRLVDPASAGLIGYWNFDDGSGTIATDLTGNNNCTLGFDGTGTDVPTWIGSTAPIIPEPATFLLMGLGALLSRRRK